MTLCPERRDCRGGISRFAMRALPKPPSKHALDGLHGRVLIEDAANALFRTVTL